MNTLLSKNGNRKLSWAEKGQLYKTAVTEFFQEESFFHGAALAYYTVFALVPMIYLATISIGKIIGQEAVLKMIDQLLKEQVGLADSSGVMSFLATADFEKGSFVMNIIGVVALLLSSSALLASLRFSINEFYDLQIAFDSRKIRLIHNLATRLLSIVFLPIFGVVIMLAYVGETILLSLGNELFGKLNTFEATLIYSFEHILAIFINVLLFTLIFKYLNDGIVKWRSAIYGGFVASILLYIGQLGIKFYLKNYFFGSDAGVAGTLLILLAWMYYSSQIIFFGAKFTKVYADMIGQKIVFKAKGLSRRKKTT